MDLLDFLNQEIKSLIEKDELEKLLKILKDKLQESLSFENELIILTARLNSLNNSIRSGTIDKNDEITTRSKIRVAILNFIDELVNETKPKTEIILTSKKEILKNKVGETIYHFNKFKQKQQNYELLTDNFMPEMANLIVHHFNNSFLNFLIKELKDLCSQKSLNKEFISKDDILKLINVFHSNYSKNYSNNPKGDQFKNGNKQSKIDTFEEIELFLEDEKFKRALMAELHPDKAHVKGLSGEDLDEEIKKLTEAFQRMITHLENKDLLGILEELLSNEIDLENISTPLDIDLESIEKFINKFDSDYWINEYKELDNHYSGIIIISASDSSLSLKDFNDLLNKNQKSSKNLMTQLKINIGTCKAIEPENKFQFQELIFSKLK